MLSSQLEEQLKKWAQLKSEDVPKVSELIKQANLPALIITRPKKSESVIGGRSSRDAGLAGARPLHSTSLMSRESG